MENEGSNIPPERKHTHTSRAQTKRERERAKVAKQQTPLAAGGGEGLCFENAANVYTPPVAVCVRACCILQTVFGCVLLLFLSFFFSSSSIVC